MVFPVPETTRVFLCRHAHPDNPGRVFYGHLPGFGLSALGVRQALGLGDFLRRYPVERVYTSPLQRARETASLAVSRLGRDVPVEVRDELVEASFGKYLQGVPQGLALVRRPLFWVHLVRPGALSIDETVPEMARRVDGVCVEAVRASRGRAAIVVSHADPIKALWNEYLGRAPWQFHFLDLAKGGFLELVYEGDDLVTIHPHKPMASAEPAPALEPGGSM